jgi:serine/threonine protein kinase
LGFVHNDIKPDNILLFSPLAKAAKESVTEKQLDEEGEEDHIWQEKINKIVLIDYGLSSPYLELDGE